MRGPREIGGERPYKREETARDGTRHDREGTGQTGRWRGGNMLLIEWVPGSEVDKPGTSGRLINLDHGKRGHSISMQDRATPAMSSFFSGASGREWSPKVEIGRSEAKRSSQ